MKEKIDQLLNDLENNENFNKLKSLPWIFEALEVLFFYFCLKLPFVNDSILFGVIIFLYIVQLLKVLIFNKNIFNGPGILAFTMLMFYSLLIFLPIVGQPYSSRVVLGGFSFLFLWMGLFHYKEIVKPYNKVIPKKELTDFSFSVSEEDTSLFIKRDRKESNKTGQTGGIKQTGEIGKTNLKSKTGGIEKYGLNEEKEEEVKELSIEDLLDELPK